MEQVADKNLKIQLELEQKDRRRKILMNILPFSGLVFIFLFFLVITGGQLVSSSNLQNLINQCFTLVIIAVGASFVYAHGGMDFSIGATCGVAQVAGSMLFIKAEAPIWFAFLITILTGVFCCVLVAGSSILARVPVFVASLCMRSIATGILSTTVAKSEIIIPFAEYKYMNNMLLKVIVLVSVIVIGVYLFEFTSLGKSERAIGGNILTASQGGIQTKKIMLIAYVLMGTCVGLAAVFQMFRTGYVTAQSGSGLEFEIMTAIVLGGFPMTGGDRSKIQAAIIGAITVTILANGLALWGLDPAQVNGVKGLLFLIIVGVSYDRSRGKLVS